MCEGTLPRASSFLVVPADVRRVAPRRVSDVEDNVVTGRFEDGQRLLEESVKLRCGAALGVDAKSRRVHACAQVAEMITRGDGALGESVGAQERFVGPARPHQGARELDLECHVDLRRGDERGHALE